MLELPPLSLYIHIPWCVRKCPYCDFNSHRTPEILPEQEYVQALINDLEESLDWVQNRKIQSIFIGGGTPSLFSANSIEKILREVQQRIGFEKDIEITLEANPGTAEQQKFADFKTVGVNRLSIGVQSFDSDHLKTLGRIHDGKQSRQAIDMALKAEFKRLNIDLMHGLPHQNPHSATQDLHTAINTGISHISWYQLTLEPNTEFFSKPPPLPAEDQLADIQEVGQSLLHQAGFRQYEVSAFALDAAACQHNINYWQFGDYLGIGAGAHGKISLVKENTIIRTQKTRQPDHYLKRYLNRDKGTTDNLRSKIQQVHADQLALEFMMNALRLKAGVPVAFFSRRTGLSTDVINQQVLDLRRKGLMKEDHSTLSASELGYKFLNSLLHHFS